MNFKKWAITFFVLLLAVSECVASPVIVNERAIFEIIEPLLEDMAPKHHHRHRHHHHKKRRSLSHKTEQESGVRPHKQMMLTKPYWPWP